MPESEPKPRLIELVDPGVGQGWKAVLKNGKSVVASEFLVTSAGSVVQETMFPGSDHEMVNMYHAGPSFYLLDLVVLLAGAIVTFLGAAFLLKRIEE